MKKINLLMVLLSVLIFSSCAKRIVVNYKSNSEKTGTIVLTPTRAVPKAYVTINDSLIVNGKFVKDITINNVPEGRNVIHFSSDSRWYSETMDSTIPMYSQKDKENVILVGVPPYSSGFWIYQGLTFAALSLLWLIPIP